MRWLGGDLPRPNERVQRAKVAFAKVNEVSRKVRMQSHFEEMGRGQRAAHPAREANWKKKLSMRI